MTQVHRTTRMWEVKKKCNRRDVEDCARRSPVLTSLGFMEAGPEWRSIVMFDTKTLVSGPGGQVDWAGPIVAGIRYCQRFLHEAPHPLEIVTLLEPVGVFHPNVAASGGMCLGHPQAGITMDLILNQIWAGLMFNMKIVNTRPGQFVNPDAAVYVRANAQRLFPISRRGLFEEPDQDLRDSQWHVFDERSANGS